MKFVGAHNYGSRDRKREAVSHLMMWEACTDEVCGGTQLWKQRQKSKKGGCKSSYDVGGMH